METKRIIKIGIFVTFAIGFLIWGFSFLKGRNIFKNERNFYAVYSSVEGLVESSPVLLNGYKIGYVRRIQFEPKMSGDLIVEFIINKDLKVPYNSTAFIFSSDIMGSKAIKLNITDSVQIHHPGDTLISGIEGDLKDQVSMQMLPLKHKAENLMLSVDSVLSVIRYIFNKKTRDNLAKSFASIKFAIENIESTTYTLDTIVTSEKRRLKSIIANIDSISEVLKNNGKPLSNAIANISNISDSLAQSELKSTITNLNTTVTQINEITDKINNGSGSLALLLRNDTLYNNVENVTYNLNRLIKDLRENPKRYVHISAFDLGRTVFITEKEDKKEKRKKKKEKE